jgi:hypothetical protein
MEGVEKDAVEQQTKPQSHKDLIPARFQLNRRIPEHKGNDHRSYGNSQVQDEDNPRRQYLGRKNSPQKIHSTITLYANIVKRNYIPTKILLIIALFCKKVINYNPNDV